ncbi:microtubule-associated protein Jupiter isoform X5 [Cataglyphis hispanica]|uniref:microtubule-associated protein Jupiter isoform X5 n=1 Tax=Cataglyphis hispanica TaxID=1086592 RepID=UPI00217FD9E5|nr:microtubule-associated protein Jupiter isoform X5 [Cataglyphis hispanica]
MATYATYRHVELDNVGYGKKRVLKPPGGGSSDIFGAEETSPRRVKTHNQSQLGSALFGNANDNTHAILSPRSNKPGNDSYNRLFGPPDAPPTPNAKNHMGNNNILSGGSSTSTLSSSTKSINSNNSLPNIANGFSSNGNNSFNDVTDGNPVTGTGYTSETQKNGPAMQNGIASSNSSSSGEKSNDTSPAAAKPRTRIPPGGYSSGLW